MMYARSRSLKQRERRQIPAPLLALLVVALWLVLTFAAIDHAFGQAVGRVGTVGKFMTPSSAADGGGGIPANAIATETDLGLLTEADDFITTET